MDINSADTFSAIYTVLPGSPLCRRFSKNKLLADRLYLLVHRRLSKSGKLVFGHAGVSSNSHLSVENLASNLNLQFQPVAFRGDSPMVPEVLAGRLDFAALSLLSVLGQDVRVLVTFAEERVPLLPDVPTAKELGVRHVPTLNGVFAPKGLPAPVKASLENTCAVAIRDTEVQQFIINGGQVPSYKNGAGFRADVAADFAIKGELISRIGLEPK